MVISIENTSYLKFRYTNLLARGDMPLKTPRLLFGVPELYLFLVIELFLIEAYVSFALLW
jgi:hypothetical protein